MPILVHFKAKNNDNSYFYKNSGLSFQWVPYYVKMAGSSEPSLLPDEIVLIDFKLTVKAVTLIFIYGRGSANSSANEGT